MKRIPCVSEFLVILKEMVLDAECIIDNSYVYFGNKSTDREGRDCENWSVATEYHYNLFKEYSQ